MPLYEYKCKKCGRKTEVLQKVDDPPIIRCTKCGGRVFKIISPPSIQFKGSGWYITDYARKKEAPANEVEKNPPPGKKKEKTASPAASTGSSSK